MPRTGAGGLGGVTGGCDGVTRGRVARRGLSHTSHSTLLPAFITVQLLHCHSEGHGQILLKWFLRVTLLRHVSDVKQKLKPVMELKSQQRLLGKSQNLSGKKEHSHLTQEPKTQTKSRTVESCRLTLIFVGFQARVFTVLTQHTTIRVHLGAMSAAPGRRTERRHTTQLILMKQPYYFLGLSFSIQQNIYLVSKELIESEELEEQRCRCVHDDELTRRLKDADQQP